MMETHPESRRYLENWQDEIDSAAEYRMMASSEPDPRLARVYANLAHMEEAHIAFWEDKLRHVGVDVGPRRPSWRSRVLGWIAQRLGPDLVLPTIAAREAADRNSYVIQPETAGTRMPAQEHWHAKVLQQLVRTQPRASPLPAPHQRQGRAVHQDAAGRLGLRRDLPHQHRTPRRLIRLDRLWYNTRRPHGSLGHKPPAARLTELNNLVGSYT